MATGFGAADSESYAFLMTPFERFAGKCAAIKQPREITHFSYDENHEYRPDDSGIRYYHPPDLKTTPQLSDGFEEFRQLPSSDEHLVSLLKCLQELEAKDGHKVDADFVTWRGMVTKFMTTLFDPYKDGFAMKATLFQDTIYIEEDFEEKMRGRKRISPVSQEKGDRASKFLANGRPSPELMTYWGYKFETLCLISDIWDNVSRAEIESRPQQVVSNYAQYCSVAETSIGGHRLIIGGEVDGLWDCRPEDPQKPTNWFELKTSAEFDDDRGQAAFERKLCSYWAQSFLIGVPKIIVGFRSPYGALERLSELHTMDLPRLIKSHTNSWDGNACINFTSQFLSFLKASIKGEGVWHIRKAKGAHHIVLQRMTTEGTGDILTKDFKQWRASLSSSHNSSKQSTLQSFGGLEAQHPKVHSEKPLPEQASSQGNDTEDHRLALEVASLLGQSVMSNAGTVDEGPTTANVTSTGPG